MKTLALVGAFCLILAGRLAAETTSWPIYAETDDLATSTTERWIVWPFLHARENSEESLRALHPLYSRHRDKATSETYTSVLWPFLRSRYRPETPSATQRTSLSIEPILYSTTGREKISGEPFYYQYLLPFFFRGGQGGTSSGATDRKYTVFFPFIWYANDAKVVIPTFPKSRPQSFQAFWPFVGAFRGYWNRDLIEFIAWPFYVHSVDSSGIDQFEKTSVVWPFLSKYSGDPAAQNEGAGGGGIGGWGFWPFYHRVEKEGEFFRASFLWPLGHRRTGRISEKNLNEQDVTLFLPFYGKVRRPNFDYDMVFPVYGKLSMKGREVRGYGLGFYNEDDNYRTGVREHRLAWFIGRWTSDIEKRPEVAQERADPMRGGGVFPFYLDYENDSGTKTRKTIVWPFYTHKYTKYIDGEEWDRTYLAPFYTNRVRTTPDGLTTRKKFVFPFFRSTKQTDGTVKRNWLHLFPYTDSPPMDRHWAPLWTVYDRYEDPSTGAEGLDVAGGLYQNETDGAGTWRKKLEMLVFSTEKKDAPDQPREVHTQLFWGLAGYHKVGEKEQTELLWMKF
ncbi:MAG: hypothetical protein RLY93_06485 [Sumerlaeia bacterium]